MADPKLQFNPDEETKEEAVAAVYVKGTPEMAAVLAAMANTQTESPEQIFNRIKETHSRLSTYYKRTSDMLPWSEFFKSVLDQVTNPEIKKALMQAEVADAGRVAAEQVQKSITEILKKLPPDEQERIKKSPTMLFMKFEGLFSEVAKAEGRPLDNIEILLAGAEILQEALKRFQSDKLDEAEKNKLMTEIEGLSGSLAIYYKRIPDEVREEVAAILQVALGKEMDRITGGQGEIDWGDEEDNFDNLSFPGVRMVRPLRLKGNSLFYLYNKIASSGAILLLSNIFSR